MTGRAPWLVQALVAAGLVACADTNDAPSALLAAEVESIALEIDYQPGGEPNVEPRMLETGALVPPFATTLASLEQLRPPDRTIHITVPQALDQMERLDDVTGDRFTDEDVLAVARAHRDVRDGPTSRSLYAVFLAGYYVRGGEVRRDVLGVSPTDRERVVALFVPAFAGSDAPGFMQQSTLVHELGHAIGLVNDGIGATTDHHDAAHGAHCTNDACVMFHQNEGLADLRQLVSRTLSTGVTTLFGFECVRDVRASVR